MATLCKNCASGYVLPGEPTGKLEEDAYVCKLQTQAEDGSSNAGGRTALIFLTDIFGLELRNSKILADSFGERLKCDVFVPDIFNGSPPLREADIAPYAPDVPNQDMGLSWFGWFKFAMVWVRAVPRLLVGRPGVVRVRAENYIRMIKSKQIYSKIAVIGYCYGGGVALGIAAQKGLVDVVVAAHAGPVDVGEVSRAVTPLMMICSEEDVWLPPPKRDQVEAALKGNTATDTKME